MKVWNSIDEFAATGKTVVTLGTFDGVHLGHRKILSRLTSHGDRNRNESVVLTFFPHPRTILDADRTVRLLNTMDEKTELLKKSGIDNLIIHPFDKMFSQLTAEEFVETILVKKLKVVKIVIGHDHRFGRDRSANIDDLVGFGKRFGFEVEQISPKEVDEVTISSTKIRKALANGDIELANQYLGYPYLLTGSVVKGRQMGRKLGFPTANINVAEPYKLIPKDGVYAVASTIDGQIVYGMMNIGNNPTFDLATKSIEIHFFDFETNLYDKKLRVKLVDRIRDEQKFANFEELQEQLARDKKHAQKLLANDH